MLIGTFDLPYSPVGALPLGSCITSDETTDTLTRALGMNKGCVGAIQIVRSSGEGGLLFSIILKGY